MVANKLEVQGRDTHLENKNLVEFSVVSVSAAFIY